MTNILLCGGSGTRLWPLSRTLMPKQFIQIFNETSLYQKTVLRNDTICARTVVVTNNDHYFIAADQIDELKRTSEKTSYLLEPVGRNTAPAIMLACLQLDESEIVLVSSSDQLILDEAAYTKACQDAEALAAEGSIVTFGITPDFAETGFGYIEAEGNDVKAFHEKPDLATAEEYLAKGNFFWNGGIFCFQVSVFLEEMQKFAPDLYAACEAANRNAKRGDVIRIMQDDMNQIPDISIDYAVMEKSQKIKMVPCDMKWSDMGSFDALYDALDKDQNGNAILKYTEHPFQETDVIAVNSNDNLFITDKEVAALDVNDLIVIDTPDALLVANRGTSQNVREIVKQLKKDGSELLRSHRTVYRPWGSFTTLEDSVFYKIKHITVKPGKRLSLQKHFHRNEHWIVVSGTAIVRVGDEEKIVRMNESTYIEMGEVHRLENQGKIDLSIIEVQIGEYTGEDDIIRLEDDFDRRSSD